MEPTTKKQASFAEVLIMYWLSSWFSLPLLVYIAVALFVLFFVPGIAGMILIVATGLGTLWFTPRFGAHFIQKRYVIPEPKKLLKWTLIWNVLFAVLGVVTVIGDALAMPAEYSLSFATLDLFETVAVVPVFYFASKRALLGHY